MNFGGGTGMSIVDIIRRSMGEDITEPKRKLKDSECNTSNKRSRLNQQIEDDLRKQKQTTIADTIMESFESFPETITIKEEPEDEPLYDEYSDQYKADDIRKHEENVDNAVSIVEIIDNSPETITIKDEPDDEVLPDDDILQIELLNVDKVELDIIAESDRVLNKKSDKSDKELSVDSNSKNAQKDIKVQANKQFKEKIVFEKKEAVQKKEAVKIKEAVPKKEAVKIKEAVQKKEAVKIKEAVVVKKDPIKIIFLQALYLRLHEDGISLLKNISSDKNITLVIDEEGVITTSKSGTDATDFVAKILKHLYDIRNHMIPRKANQLWNYIDAVLKELSKESSVEELTIIANKLRTCSSYETSVLSQSLNLRIYGHFHWEYGNQFTDILKNIPRVKSDEIVDISIIECVEDCLRYLIKNERPIKLYEDIIESIHKNRNNFVYDTYLLSIKATPKVAKMENTCNCKILIDSLKYDYFFNSSTVQFMTSRWKSKLKITFEDVGDDTFLCLEGLDPDIEAAHAEFKLHIAEGPMLPFGKAQMYSFALHLLTKIQSIQQKLDCFKPEIALAQVMTLEKQPLCDDTLKQINELYEKLHTYIFVTRGLQQGKEKLVILQEFIANYRPSLLDDNTVNSNEWKDVQDAFVVLHFKKLNISTNYIYFLKCVNSMRHTETIILTIDQFKILSETAAGKSIIAVLEKLVDFDIGFSRKISTEHVSITIVGSNSGKTDCKKRLYEFLDRVTICESDTTALERILSTALDSIWSKPISKADATLALDRLELLATNTFANGIETERELYLQLHVYLFGRCRLLQAHTQVTLLRMYYHYVKSSHIKLRYEVLHQIFQSFEFVFGKTKKSNINYRRLLHSTTKEKMDSWSLTDKNTICICDSVVKVHFHTNPTAKKLIANYKDETKISNQALIHDIKKFVYGNLLLYSSDGENATKLPILIKSESVRIFSQVRSLILADLTVSLHAIEEIKQNMNPNKACAILHHVQELEKNCTNENIIEEKYQVLNIYLFGCFEFMGSKKHIDFLKQMHIKLSMSDEKDGFISERATRTSLINAYEFIFWKGRKPDVDYDFLLYETAMIVEKSTKILPVETEMFGYFTNVQQGIDFMKAYSEIVKIQQNSSGNVTFFQFDGAIEKINDAVKSVMAEMKRIKPYCVYSFNKKAFAAYLKQYLDKIICFDTFEIPANILLDLKDADRLLQEPLSDPDCIKILSMKKLYYSKLHQYIFGISRLLDGDKQFAALKDYVNNLSNSKTDILDLNIIISIHDIMNNLFSGYKMCHLDYAALITESINNQNNRHIHFHLPSNVFEYLTKCNDGLQSTELLKKHLDLTTKTVSIESKGELSEKLREHIEEYTSILQKLPMIRNDLLNRVNLVFSKIEDVQNRDPHTILTSLKLFSEDTSRYRLERIPIMYARLHTYLFGFCQLLDGQQFVRSLGQHVYNLKNMGKPSDLISLLVLKDIKNAIQYIEGSEERDLDYQALITESKKSHQFIEYQESLRNPLKSESKNIVSEITLPRHIIVYLQNTAAGKSIRKSVQDLLLIMTFESECLKIKGPSAQVKEVTKNINQYVSMIFQLPKDDIQLRHVISNSLKILSNNKIDIVNIANLYSEIFKLELENFGCDKKANRTLLCGYYHKLHLNLFGSLRLLEGETHLDLLRKFDEGKLQHIDEERMRLFAAYDYIFGSTKKAIDYNFILRDVCGYKCVYVSKLLTRLFDIHHRVKKGKDKFIASVSITQIDKWIRLMKDDFYDDKILRAVYVFLEKYEDARDNRHQTSSI